MSSTKKSGGSRKDKILYLEKIFKERTDEKKGLTVNEIIEILKNEYDISAERKAIYNDIETLKAFGMEIEMKKNKDFRYYLNQKNDFKLHELKLLVDAVQASKYITHAQSMELIRKIEGLTSPSQARQLSRQVYVTNRVKTMNESIYANVDEIHTAINENHKISFHYFDWNIKKERELRHGGKLYVVSPWALTTNDENYYLIAYDSEAKIVKHYRVDKMIDIEKLGEKRDGKEHFDDFDLAVYSNKIFSMYHGDETRVTLRCKNSMAGVIIDRFGRNETFFRHDDEHFDVNLRVAVSHVFFSWLLMFTGDIEVISPKSVREEVAKFAEEALKKYK